MSLPRTSATLALVFASSLAALADGESPASASKSQAMDYGPFLSHTVAMPGAKNYTDLETTVIKGITIQLKDGDKVVGAATFDTMLCRWAGAWVAEEGKPPLKLVGTPFDGSHGTCPKAQGTPIFSTRPVPGWAKDGKLDDPRTSPYVPLPRDRARYGGLIVKGDKVGIHYEVGGDEIPVFEMPQMVAKDGLQWFERIMEVGPAKSARTFVVCDAPESWKVQEGMIEFSDNGTHTTLGLCEIVGRPSAGAWKLIGKQLCFELPPLKDAARIRLSLWRGANETRPTRAAWQQAIARVSLPNLDEFNRDEDPRYPQRIVTQGKLGNTGAAYEVDTLTLPDENPWKAWMRPTGVDFFKDGKTAAICTWSGDVWLATGINDTLEKLEWKRFATGLFQPLGLKIVDDTIYVLGRDQITRLLDTDADGAADHYDNFNNDISCTPNYHEFATDLQTDAAGNFYFGKSSPLKGSYNWDVPGPHNGCMVRVSKDGSKLDVIATGIRATNGCGVGPNGEITNADNEGIWTPVSRINWVGHAGGAAKTLPPFFGALGMDHRATPPTTYDPPLCWLPWGMDNSPGGQVWAGNNFGPLTGAMLHLSYGKCAVFNVLSEEVGGVMQGGIVKVPVTFGSGAMRGRVNPRDGQLYVCGLRGWQTTAAKDGCLQRLRYTGKPFDTVTGMRVGHDAIELTASTPLDPNTVCDPENWDIQWWNYRWTKSYGSDLYSVSDPTKNLGKRGQLKGEAAPIKGVRLSPDGKTMTIEIPGLAPVMQVVTRANLKTASGAPFKVEIGHTINKVP